MNKPIKEGDCISMRQYVKHTEPQWRGVKVETLLPLQNRNITVPAGTVLEIRGKFSGFKLFGEKCNCCGAQAWFNEVQPNALRIVE